MVSEIKRIDYSKLNKTMLVNLLEEFGQFKLTLIKGRKVE